MNKFLSIITVTFNDASNLEKTILSVSQQSIRKNLEYIVIDGGSTDRTSEILKKHNNSIDKLLSEPDNGLYDAMNKGLKLATSEYVLFLNAGDRLFSDNTLELIMKEFLMDSPDIIYGNTMMIDQNDQIKGQRRLKSPKKLNWKSFRLGMRVCHQSFIVKKEIAPPYDLQYKLASDIDWCIKCMKSTDQIKYFNNNISCFLTGGVSSSKRKQGLIERFSVMKKHYSLMTTVFFHFIMAFRLIYQVLFTGAEL